MFLSVAVVACKRASLISCSNTFYASRVIVWGLFKMDLISLELLPEFCFFINICCCCCVYSGVLISLLLFRSLRNVILYLIIEKQNNKTCYLALLRLLVLRVCVFVGA
jgi:hypothetical protein